MKRILIPTDFSDNSWNAIVYAFNFFENTPCEFHIVNAYDLAATQLLTTISSQKIGQQYELLRSASKKGLDMIMEDIENSKTSMLHSFKTISRLGELVEVLQSLLKENHYDLVLMATKGATGAKEIFMGSNTHKVVQYLDSCPVLVIPEECRYQEISNIAFATNFERMYFKSEINSIKDLGKIHDATIRMIQVYEEPKLSEMQSFNSSTLEHYFSNRKHDFHVIEDFSTVENAIQAFIEELEIDVLAMINYPHGFIKRLLREPVIKKITFHTVIPFLVIPADN